MDEKLFKRLESMLKLIRQGSDIRSDMLSAIQDLAVRLEALEAKNDLDR